MQLGCRNVKYFRRGCQVQEIADRFICCDPIVPPGVGNDILFPSTSCVPSQADAIYNMVGYPKFIMDAKELDKVFNDVGK